MSLEKVAIIIGGSRGIGKGIVKGLRQRFSGIIYLTSRYDNEGGQTVEELRQPNLNLYYHQLDINDQASIDNFKKYIEAKHGGVDIIINAAVINFKFHVSAYEIIDTNYYGKLRVLETLIPLLRENGRIVNVTGSTGHLSKIRSQEKRNCFSNPNLTINQLNYLMNYYVRASENKSNTRIIDDWSISHFVVSNVGVSALTRIYQRMLDRETPSRNILVNTVNPGYVYSYRTEEAITAPLSVALEPHTMRGKFIWSDGIAIDWLANNIPEDF